ncbi:MAG TPA: DUF1614 domain-containing protein [Patescibacteria group bacterium]|nr:DUF1614 domain-containing protein [Patescibacteria group bacterium]
MVRVRLGDGVGVGDCVSCVWSSAGDGVGGVVCGSVSPLACTAQVVYIGGTLVGADLLNLGRLPELGASVVSVGSTGPFDGIYLTGLVSVLLM